MAIPAYYQEDMARALPGQVSDTSAYNIDGACVVNEAGRILVGVGVQVVEVVDGHKDVKQITNGGIPYGVAIRSHFQTTSANGEMFYEEASGINVMTAGRVWMRVSDENLVAQTYGTPVKLDVNGLANTGDGGVIVTGWTYTGDVTTFQGIKLAEVQLHQV
jgi:hypothetical protein